MTPIGRVCELAKYPVKSMAGTPLDAADLGLHGIEGDRRFAFRRVGDGGGFPFLTAGRFPELLTYRPVGEPLPTHVRTPSGAELEIRSDELRDEIARRSGHAVELMMFKHGIFDDGTLSIISATTIDAICGEAGVEIDRRRMRMNVVLDTDGLAPFGEDASVGATLVVGDAVVSVTARDERCAMVNMDPDTGKQDPRVMKVVVHRNGNYAGVYATVVRAGSMRVGQTVHLVR
ncbi:MAG TPA: MOSC N-terminal beta barrel domain-containing protein [Thermoanaerobaculia bacterium]|nr:MOSC N-terminal beta barrel domain-containing protein [Thermoanaerobaculia bacterium]